MPKKNTTVKTGKAAIYAQYGIEYKDGYILAPLFGWIRPLLLDGNSKLGKGVWTFSTLAGNIDYHVAINGIDYTVRGTCPCNCKGCYAQTGFYRMPDVIRANAIKTILAREHLDFVKRAIIAQIHADNIKLSRIHASGDFFSNDYVQMWRDVCIECPECTFWTYTKNREAESAFDDINNINIVKSCIPGYGFNFGHCDYIIRLYKALTEAGHSVYICRCGIDKNQHCTNCKGCSKHDYVLFVEHSTSYKAEQDPYYDELKAIIEAQPGEAETAAA